MKTTYAIWSALAAAAVLLPAAIRAEDAVTNRLTLSARFGLNMSARFIGFAPGPRSERRPNLAGQTAIPTITTMATCSRTLAPTAVA
jgi:hypothetical protein